MAGLLVPKKKSVPRNGLANPKPFSGKIKNKRIRGACIKRRGGMSVPDFAPSLGFSFVQDSCGHGINFGVLSGKGLFERFSTGQMETMPGADSWFYGNARILFSIWKIFDKVNRFIVGMKLLTFRFSIRGPH